MFAAMATGTSATDIWRVASDTDLSLGRGRCRPVLRRFASARRWRSARVGVRLVRDPPAPVDASNREIVDEVATEVIRLDEDRYARVADQVDGANVGSIVRPGEARLAFDELGEVGNRLVGVHSADVAEHVGVGVKGLAHLVAVAVGPLDVQLDE